MRKRRSALVLLAGVSAVTLSACSSGGSSSQANTSSTHQRTRQTAPAAQRTTTSTSAANQAATWQALPGSSPYDYNDAALLFANSSGSGNPTSFQVVDTSSGATATINPQTPLGTAQMDSDGASAALVTPSSGHPVGETVIFVGATTPAQGLTPESDNVYILVYDNKMGSLVYKDELGPRSYATGYSVPNPVPRPWRYLSLPIVDAVDLSNGTSISQYGAPQWQPTNTASFPTASYASSGQGFGTLILAVSSAAGCDNLVAVNAVTLKQLSTSTGCFPFDGSSVSVGATSATAYAVSCNNCSGNLTAYSMASGQPIGLPAGPMKDTTTCGGVRSTLLALSPPENGSGDAYFVDSSTFAVVYTVQNTSQLGFSCLGEADNDFWVTTTSGNIVVNQSGAQIATGWKIFPVYGGPGWTAFESSESPGSDTTSWYLLRSSAPAVQAMATAPNPS